MKKIIKFRGQGKTTDLIKMSAETGYRIVTFGDTRYIIEMANKMGLEIPNPISKNEYNLAQYRGDKKPILVDELEQFVYSCIGHEIYAATLNAEDVVIDASQNPISQLKNALVKLILKYQEIIGKGDFNVSYQILKNIEKINELVDFKDETTVKKKCLYLHPTKLGTEIVFENQIYEIGHKSLNDFVNEIFARTCIVEQGNIIQLYNICVCKSLGGLDITLADALTSKGIILIQDKDSKNADINKALPKLS